MSRILRIILIIIAIYFIIVFSLVWLGIIAGVSISLPFLTNFFPDQEVITVISMMNLLFVIGIPLITIIMGIIRVVFRRRIGKGWMIGLGLFWLMNTISLVGLGSTLAQEFLVEDQVEQLMDASTFASDTVRLSINKVDFSEGPRLRFGIGPENIELPGASINTNIRKSADADWHLMLHKTSRARNGKDARALASEMKIMLDSKPGELIIPSQVPFHELRKWRVQEAAIELSMPVGAYVYIEDHLVNNGADMPLDQHPDGVNLYQMNKAGKLICQDCPAASTQAEELTTSDQQLSYQDFQSIALSGPMKVTIEQGETYDIQYSGNGNYQKQLNTIQEAGTLKISLTETVDTPVRLYITVPSLNALSLINTDDILVRGFTLENLAIFASGEFELKTDVNVETFTLDAQNGVEVEFIGSTEQLVASLSNESRLDTDRGSVNEATITAVEGSRVKLGENVSILEQNISEDSSLKIIN